MPIAKQLRLLTGLSLLALAGAGGARAQDQPDSAPVRGPVIGFVHDRAAGIRPILGLPGAATLGPPVLSRVAFESVAFAPGLGHALAILARQRSVALIRNLAGAPAVSALGAPDGPGLMVLSPSGDAAALFYPETAKLEVLAGLPDSPHVAWSTGVPAEIAALAVSDGGGLVLYSGGGQPAQVFLAARGLEPRFVLSAAASSSLAFLERSEEAAIADGLTGDIVVARNLRAEPQLARIGGPEDGVTRPVAIAALPGNRRILVANAEPPGVVGVALAGGEPFAVACRCAPTSLERMAGGYVYRLSEPGKGPVWLLNTAAAAPEVVFVPDQPLGLRDRGRVPAPRPAGGAK